MGTFGHSGARLTAADGLASGDWEEAWSGGEDGGDELDQLEVRVAFCRGVVMLC